MTDTPAEADADLLLTDRPELVELRAEQIAPIERRTAGWPESWRDIARSLYVTLVTAEGVAADAASTLAARLMIGVAADMGGMQPYINMGDELVRSGRVARVIEMLRARPGDYEYVAAKTGVSARHVRRIEAAWLRQERTRRQRGFDFEQP